MRSFLSFAAFVVVLAGTTAASATVQVSIDLTHQRMHVTSNQGAFDWPISSARSGFYTPGGSFAPTHLEAMHYSRKYHMSPMPAFDLLPGRLRDPRHLCHRIAGTPRLTRLRKALAGQCRVALRHGQARRCADLDQWRAAGVAALPRSPSAIVPSPRPRRSRAPCRPPRRPVQYYGYSNPAAPQVYRKARRGRSRIVNAPVAAPRAVLVPRLVQLAVNS